MQGENQRRSNVAGTGDFDPRTAQQLDYAELLDGLAAGVVPEHLPEWPQITTMLPVFKLCRSMFYHSPADTALKLLVITNLARVEGRFTRARIRTLIPALDNDRLEAVVTALYSGGWLELRDSDHSYRVRPLGLYLLSVLLAADFASQSPSNLLIRAVEAIAFSDRLSADGQTTGYLLSVLLAELETQAAHARVVMARGTPRQLIRFSRQEVQQQIKHVMQVLSAIEERMDEASEHFGRVVRIHESLQIILRAHEGLTKRLAEWSLKRLETSEAGYSLAALSEAVLGASDDELMQLVGNGTIWPLSPAMCLSTDRLLTRYRTGRRTMAAQKREFVYEAPPEPTVTELQLADVDPVTRLRERIAAWLAQAPGRRLELVELLADDADDFADAVYQLTIVARIQGQAMDGLLQLTPSLAIRIQERDFDPERIRGLSAEAALVELQRIGVLVDVAGKGRHSAIDVVVVEEHDEP